MTKAFGRVGAEVEIAEDAAALARARRLVLPGVGAFGEGMAGLRRRGLVEPLQAFAASGRPLLGICLGAQLLMEESEEFGRHEGLGLIPGLVRRLAPDGVKVPHVGWQKILPASAEGWTGSLLSDTAPGTWTYFVHSFQCQPVEPLHLFAEARYGTQAVTAAVRRDGIVGVQFHPEKSGAAGLTMLRTWLNDPSL